MPGIFWRIIVAVLMFVFLVVLLLPLVLRVLGLDPGGDVLQIIRICAAAIAVFYIIWGAWPPPWRA